MTSIPDLRNATGPKLDLGAGMSMRPLLVQDVTEAYVSALNDKQVNKFLVSAKQGQFTADNVKKMVSENFAAEDAVLFGIFCDNAHCGNVRLHNIAHPTAFLGIAIFDMGRQGKGVGAKAIRTVADYGISQLRLESVFAGIDPRNVASVRAFAKAGFVNIMEANGRTSQLYEYKHMAIGFRDRQGE